MEKDQIKEEPKHREKPEPKKTAPKKTELMVEIDGAWVPAKKAPMGTPITGAKSNTDDIWVKTVNGWFNETDPEKEPVIMVKVENDKILLTAHVKGGEWLPLGPSPVGCNIPIDALSFVKLAEI